VDFRRIGRVTLWSSIVLGVTGGALRLLLVRTWVVPSDDPIMSASIAPSLSPGDVVVLLHAGRPSFGDLVRCTDPDEPRRWVIGRIVGEAGDTVHVDAMTLHVNNKKAVKATVCSTRTVTVRDPTTNSPVEIQCDVEEIGGSAHKRGIRTGEWSVPTVEKTVPQGFIWLVSDNRAYPNDSRHYGAVKPETCDSRVIFRLWGAKGYGDVESRFTFVQ
jgi:signal peptidase I